MKNKGLRNVEFVQEALAQVQQAAAQILYLHNDSLFRKVFGSARNETLSLCNKLLHEATLCGFQARKEMEIAL